MIAHGRRRGERDGAAVALQAMPGAVVRWSQRHASWLRTIAVFTPAVLLFIPILRYSLDTPFALIDDYADWKYSVIFTSPSLFGDWIAYTFIDTESLRYRPFWELYNAISWSIFGTNPWLHHLARWVLHFAAILMFVAAFLRFARKNGDGTGANWMIPIVPVAFLVYLWMFFPNSPASRLSPQEVYTVFFLGICTLVVAITLTGVKQPGWIHSGATRYVLFFLGFTGLVLSKEVNAAVALWLLLAYVAWAVIDPGKMRRIIGAIPLTLVLAFSVYRVYVSSGNNESSAFDNHMGAILAGMFQTETSLVVTVVFSILLGSALAIASIRFIRRWRDPESLFLLFLIGSALSLYLAISFFFDRITLRYWYPVFPVFVMIMAFSVKYFLLQSSQISIWFSRAIAASIFAFALFFVAVNYYNFSSQTISQHSARNADATILEESLRLLAREEYVHGFLRDKIEQERRYNQYFSDYHPFFHGNTPVDITWIGHGPILDISFQSPVNIVHRSSPDNPERPYYLVSYRQDAILLDLLETHKAISAGYGYRILSHARMVAKSLQGKTPYVSVDFGSPIFDGYQEITYGWTIYRVPFGNYMDRIVDSLRASREQAITSAPVARSTFDVYLLEDDLVYVREQCAPEDADAWFFLHLTPVDADDLPGERREHGFDNLDFRFGTRGARFDGRCVASVRLPDYAIAGIRTGQYAAGGQIWRVEFAPDR